MDALKKYFGTVVGTTVASFFVRIVVALLGLYVGSVTDLGDAVGQALDKERSIAAAVELIKETPRAEILEAVNSTN